MGVKCEPSGYSVTIYCCNCDTTYGSRWSNTVCATSKAAIEKTEENAIMNGWRIRDGGHFCYRCCSKPQYYLLQQLQTDGAETVATLFNTLTFQVERHEFRVSVDDFIAHLDSWMDDDRPPAKAAFRPLYGDLPGCDIIDRILTCDQFQYIIENDLL